MFVFVYGTLKQGAGNDAYFLKNATKIEDYTVPGYKLYDSGFPVARPDPTSSVRGEIWDIGDPEEEEQAAETLRGLDRLEGNGRMYQRTFIGTKEGRPLMMYVGMETRFPFDRMRECPSKDGVYVWGREYSAGR